jgi:hypothetical protein
MFWGVSFVSGVDSSKQRKKRLDISKNIRYIAVNSRISGCRCLGKVRVFMKVVFAKLFIGLVLQVSII